jgi:hypothetical protein
LGNAFSRGHAKAQIFYRSWLRWLVLIEGREMLSIARHGNKEKKEGSARIHVQSILLSAAVDPRFRLLSAYPHLGVADRAR